MIQIISHALVAVSALLAIAIVVIYQVLSRWWETPYGRHMFAFQTVMAVCLSLWASRLSLPKGEWFEVARLVAFTLVPVVLVWRILIIIRAWREERALREQENPHE